MPDSVLIGRLFISENQHNQQKSYSQRQKKKNLHVYVQKKSMVLTLALGLFFLPVDIWDITLE